MIQHTLDLLYLLDARVVVQVGAFGFFALLFFKKRRYARRRDGFLGRHALLVHACEGRIERDCSKSYDLSPGGEPYQAHRVGWKQDRGEGEDRCFQRGTVGDPCIPAHMDIDPRYPSDRVLASDWRGLLCCRAQTHTRTRTHTNTHYTHQLFHEARTYTGGLLWPSPRVVSAVDDGNPIHDCSSFHYGCFI